MKKRKILIVYFLFLSFIFCFSNEKIINFLKNDEQYKAFQEIETLSSGTEILNNYSSVARTLYYDEENLEWSSIICYGAISHAFRKYNNSNSNNRDNVLFKAANLCEFILNSCWNDYIDGRKISKKTIINCLKIANENLNISGILRKPDYEIASSYFLLSRIEFIDNNRKKAFHNINMAINTIKKTDPEDSYFYTAYSGFYNLKWGNKASGKSLIELSKTFLKNSKKEKASRYIEEIIDLEKK